MQLVYGNRTGAKTCLVIRLIYRISSFMCSYLFTNVNVLFHSILLTKSTTEGFDLTIQ